MRQGGMSHRPSYRDPPGSRAPEVDDWYPMPCASRVTSSHMEVIVKAGYQEMSATTARMIVAAIQEKPNLVLCLSAGNTPTGTYRELVRLHDAAGLNLSNVAFFFLDEYDGLTTDHPESFRSYLDRELFKPAHIPVANIHGPDLNY